MDIKHLDFTEQDFQLLVEGLDSLPNKDQAGELMQEMILGMVMPHGAGVSEDDIESGEFVDPAAN